MRGNFVRAVQLKMFIKLHVITDKECSTESERYMPLQSMNDERMSSFNINSD